MGQNGQAPISIRLLGTFEVKRSDGTPINSLGRRGVALLTYLLLAEQPCSREELAELLWSGRSQEQSRASLRQELLRLRRTLGWDHGLSTPGGQVKLPDGLAVADALAFRQALRASDEASAIPLYRGALLADYQLQRHDPFSEWLVQQRVSFHTAAVELMLRQLRSSEASPRLAERVLSLEGACEEAHRFLMRHHANRGDLGRVLKQFRTCAEALSSVGLEPGAETATLLDEITTELGPRVNVAPLRSQPQVEWIRRAPDRAVVPSAPVPKPLPEIEDRPSIAVLPFADLSIDPLVSGVLAEGMTEEITNALARIPGFFVTARQSALVYRGLAMDVRRIATELGVRYLVEGSVEQDGRRMRANLRLIDGRTGLHLWAETQSAPLHDLMAVRDALVHQLAMRLEPRLLLEEIGRAVRRPPENLDAWTCLQRANGVLLRGRHREALEQVMEPLHRALQVDPGYAMAKALLSAVHSWRAVSQSFPDPPAEKVLAQEYAEAALSTDPENPFVLVHCAETAMYSGADIDAALRMLEMALARDPNDANGMAMLAHVRRSAGEDAYGSLNLIGDAIRLSPRDPRTFLWHHYASWCHLRVGDLERMEAASRRSIELYGRYPLSWIALTSALGLRGRFPEAKEAAAVLRRMHPSFSPDGFYEIASRLYGHRFAGPIDREYSELRRVLRLVYEQ